MSDTPPPDAEVAAPAAPPAAPPVTAPAAAPAAAAPPELGPAACGEKLAELFPALFAQPRPLPLKLRIQADIQQRAPGQFTRRTLSAFLHRHTTSTAYLTALARAGQRFDLDGAPAGELSAEHRDAAAAELARRRALHEARRAAERAEQQRAQAAEFDARRARAALLRAFETSTLSRANFCALKGIAEAELDARLDQARRERDERPPAPPRTDPRPPQRPAEARDARRRRGPPPGHR